MRINLRLIIISFSIALALTVVSAFVYTSLAVTLVTNQQNRVFSSSYNNFKSIIEEVQRELTNHNKEIKENLSDSTKIIVRPDLILRIKTDSLFELEAINAAKINYTVNKTFYDFRRKNPGILLEQFNSVNGISFFYGKVLDEALLQRISEKINVDVLVFNDEQILAGNPSFLNPEDILKLPKNVYNIQNPSRLQYGNEEVIFQVFRPMNIISTSNNLYFVVYLRDSSVPELKKNMLQMTLIVIGAGLPFSIIFILLFTFRLRRQISNLEEIAGEIIQGKITKRADIIADDETGKLAFTFNNMLDVIEKKEKEDKDYSQIISILNRKGALKDLADAVLYKICNSLKSDLAILYLTTDENQVEMISSYGLFNSDKEYSKEFLKGVIQSKEIKVYENEFGLTKIKSGMADISVKKIIIIPVIYGEEVISVIELGSFENYPINYEYVKDITDEIGIALMNSISREKLQKLVADLREINSQYENTNSTLSLKNEELVNLQKELQKKADELEIEKQRALELSELKSQFLTSMSHELRTPLNSILGLTEFIMKEKSLSKSADEKLNIIYKSGKTLLALINNILELSKIEAGKTIINKIDFDLDEFLSEIRIFTEGLLSGKPVKLIIQNNSPVNILRTDKNKLHQILTNLIGNAVKFTEKGFIKTEVDYKAGNLVVSVMDTGIGIETEKLSLIFEEFRQGDSSTSRKYGGTGLGLAITQKYIGLLNGELKVESEKSIGSTFTFSIPVELGKKTNIKETVSRVALFSKNNEIFSLIGNYLESNNYRLELITDYNYKTSAEKLQDYSTIIISLEDNITDTYSLIGNIRRAKVNSNIKILVVRFSDSLKNGYAFAVEDYILQSHIPDKISSWLNESHGENKKVRISCKSEIKSLINSINTSSFELEFVNLDIQNVVISIPDLIFINSDELDLLTEIRKVRELRHTSIFVVIKELPESNQEMLYNKLSARIAELNYHPFDVLRIIRDELKIKENAGIIKRLLVDDDKESDLFTGSKDKATAAKGKILVVDDDKNAQYTVSEILRAEGYEIVTADNGLECINHLRLGKFDLILLDIMMPVMDGFETIKRIRRDKNMQTLKVFALTAHAMLDDKSVLDKNGFDDIVTKPINTEIVLTKIRKILSE